MKKAGVAILGLGVVGGGTYQILTEKREYFKKTQGVDLTVESVLVRNKQKALDLGVEEGKIATFALLGKAGYEAKKKELDSLPAKDEKCII